MLIPTLLALGGHAAGLVRRGYSLDWMAAPLRRRRAATARRRSGLAMAGARRVAPLLPPGVELTALLAAARQQFVRMQAAWDAGDLEQLGELTSPAVWRDLHSQISGRGDANCTEVVSLQARLLDCVEAPTGWLISVEFTGDIREAAEQAATPFREWWLLAREKRDGDSYAEASWRLMRQQTLF